MENDDNPNSTGSAGPTGYAGPGDQAGSTRTAGGEGAGSQGPRTLHRDTRKAVLGGVSAGVGRYLGIDPVIIRIAFIVLAFTGGLGVVAYLIAWALIPGDGGEDVGEEMRRAVQGAPTWLQVLGVVAVGLFLAGQVDGFPSSLAWAAVLIGAGVVLFRESDRDRSGPESRGGEWHSGAAPSHPSGASAAPAGTAGAWRPGDAEPGGAGPGGAGPGDEARGAGPGRAGPGAGAGDTGPTSAGSIVPPSSAPGAIAGWGGVPPRVSPPPAPAAPSGPPPLPRPRPVLGRLTIAAAFIWCGSAALLDNAGLFSLEPRQYVAMATAIVGLGLLIGSWWGRGRGLILVGLLLLPVLLLSGFPATTVGGGMGERVYRPDALADVRPSYELFAGSLTVDLADLELDGADLDVAVRVGMGEMIVIVPPHIELLVDGVVAAGEAEILDRRDQGVAVGFTHRFPSEIPTGSSIDLSVQQGFGSIVVRQSAEWSQ